MRADSGTPACIFIRAAATCGGHPQPLTTSSPLYNRCSSSGLARQGGGAGRAPRQRTACSPCTEGSRGMGAGIEVHHRQGRASAWGQSHADSGSGLTPVLHPPYMYLPLCLHQHALLTLAHPPLAADRGWPGRQHAAHGSPPDRTAGTPLSARTHDRRRACGSAAQAAPTPAGWPAGRAGWGGAGGGRGRAGLEQGGERAARARWCFSSTN